MRSFSILVICTLGVSIALGYPLPGIAQSESHRATQWFERLDQNKDQILTFEEIGTECQNRYNRIDANGDGLVDENEFLSGIPESESEMRHNSQTRFQVMDRDGNGRVERPECVAFHQRIITVSDTNKDSAMSREEFLAQVGE